VKAKEQKRTRNDRMRDIKGGGAFSKGGSSTQGGRELGSLKVDLKKLRTEGEGNRSCAPGNVEGKWGTRTGAADSPGRGPRQLAAAWARE